MKRLAHRAGHSILAFGVALAVQGCGGDGSPDSPPANVPVASRPLTVVSRPARANSTVAIDADAAPVHIWLTGADQAVGGSLGVNAGNVCGRFTSGTLQLREHGTATVVAEGVASGRFVDLNTIDFDTRGTFSIDDKLCKNSRPPYDLVAACPSGNTTTLATVTCFTPHDPSGHINDQLGGPGDLTHAIPCTPQTTNTHVTLWVIPDSVPGTDCKFRPTTGSDWSNEPAASVTAGGVRAGSYPPLDSFFAGNSGNAQGSDDQELPPNSNAYGWDAPSGCYYVEVTAGNAIWRSPVVGTGGTNITQVNDLHLTRYALQPHITIPPTQMGPGKWGPCANPNP